MTKHLDVAQCLQIIDSTNTALKSYMDHFDLMEAAISRVLELEGSLKGKGGEALLRNYQELQLPAIRACRAFIERVMNKGEKLQSLILAFEPSENGMVSEDFYANQIPRGYDRFENFMEQNKSEIDSIAASVSHIIDLGKLDISHVQGRVDDARKHAKDVVEGLYELDHEGMRLMRELQSDMEELRAILKQVIEWTVSGGPLLSGVDIQGVRSHFEDMTLHTKAPEVRFGGASGVNNPPLTDNLAFQLLYSSITNKKAPVVHDRFTLPFDYRNPIYFTRWISSSSYMNQVNSEIVSITKSGNPLGGEIIWEKDNGKLQITKGEEVDYAALGITPISYPLTYDDDIVINYKVIDGQLVVFKDDPRFYYYTQNASQGKFNAGAGILSQIVAQGYASVYLANKLKMIPGVGGIIRRGDAGHPLYPATIITSAGVYVSLDSVPLVANIIGTPVPKSGTKEVLVYLSEDKDDWRNVHKVMITLPSDAVEIKVREGKKP